MPPLMILSRSPFAFTTVAFFGALKVVSMDRDMPASAVSNKDQSPSCALD